MKPKTAIEANELEKDSEYPQEYDSDFPIVNHLDNLNEKKTNEPRVQTMFKRSRHYNITIFKITQDYYELPKRTISANGNIYHIFKANILRDVQNL